MPRLASFWTKAMTGYAAVTLFLACGTVLAIRRLDTVASAQIGRIRAEEHDITLAERLRWNGELTVSAGRGYLLTGDPALLTKLQETEGNYNDAIHALKNTTLASSSDSLIALVERAATRFNRTQEQLLPARQGSENNAPLIRRFETELLPLRLELGQSLDRLVDHKEARITAVYDQAERDRTRLTLVMYGLLCVLVLVSLGIAWSISERLTRSYRQKQEALEATHKALAARDEIMGLVAHDLRNPLGTILMKAAILRNAGESDRTRKEAQSIENIIMQMKFLITTMLDVATLEAGRFSVTPTLCDVEELLRGSIEVVDSASTSKMIRIESDVRRLPLTIRADRERVIQVLSNLLGNAVKFTPPGGRVALSADRQGDSVRFAISDTGPGIASQHISQVFGRFWKHEADGKQGTGLGLFIAKGIVDAHGGRIWVESTPARGATFYFTLPVGKPEPVTTCPAEFSEELVHA